MHTGTVIWKVLALRQKHTSWTSTGWGTLLVTSTLRPVHILLQLFFLGVATISKEFLWYLVHDVISVCLCLVFFSFLFSRYKLRPHVLLGFYALQSCRISCTVDFIVFFSSFYTSFLSFYISLFVRRFKNVWCPVSETTDTDIFNNL
jgi:hypothetical protein